jgi:protein-ribulosamine 3-kinase
LSRLDDALAALGLDRSRCGTRSVHGGDIHAAWRVEADDGRLVFVKTNERPLPAIFDKEARGLDALRAACEADGGLLRVPRALGSGEHFLALEWIDERGAGHGDPGRRLGEGLAALHRHGSDSYGWHEDNWIGSLPQPNDRMPAQRGCGAFYAARRLQAQSEQGAGRLGSSLRGRIDRFCARIDDFLPLPDERPALLHGDLWGGNWTVGVGGVPWIYDPAVHHGCREAELAFTRLFGGFPRSFYAAYEASFPLSPGFAGRVDLWNLYPLLVHANLFGGGYAGQVDSILRRCVG